jgi:predicted nucleotidyltransferase
VAKWWICARILIGFVWKVGGMTPEEWIDVCIRCENEFRREGVISLVVGGSIGRGQSTDTSDLDLFLISPEEQLDRLLTGGVRRLATCFGRVLLFRGPALTPYFGYTFSALCDGLKLVQFTCNSEKTLCLSPMGAHGLRTIFDDASIYRDFERKCSDIPDPYPELLEKCVSTFWLRAVLLRNALTRNLEWLAQRHLVDMRDEMLMLARIKLNTLGYAFNRPAKNAEIDLPAELLSEIAATTSYRDSGATYTAWLRSISWFLAQTREYAESHSFAVPILEISQSIYASLRSSAVSPQAGGAA